MVKQFIEKKSSLNVNKSRSNLNKLVLFLGLIFIFSIIISGAVSAADNTSNQTDNAITSNTTIAISDSQNSTVNEKNLDKSNSNTQSNIQNSSKLPDPQIWRNGVLVGSYTTITDAVNAAQSGDTIILEPGTYKENNINIKTSLSIVGQTQTGTIIDGQGLGNIFIITPDNGIIFTLINVTLQNGIIQNGTSPYNGGAIDYENSNGHDGILNITNVIFAGNSAYNGGAIYAYNVNLNIKNSTFTGNIASNGGAIYNTYGTINDNNNIFIDNTAYYGGGAIYNDWFGNLTEINSTFTGNSGGAIFNGAANAVINYCRIMGNTALQGNDISNTGTMDATLNWWGTNNLNEIKNDIFNDGTCIYDPWIVLSVNASPISIPVGGSSSITADLLHDNHGIIHDPVNGLIPYTGSANFESNNGTIEDANFNNGTATTTLNIGNNQGVVNVSTTVDNQTANTPVYVGFCFVTVNPVNRVTPTQTITITFSEPIETGPNYNNIQVFDQNGAIQSVIASIIDNTLIINPTSSLGTRANLQHQHTSRRSHQHRWNNPHKPINIKLHSTSKHRLCQHRW